MRFPTPRLAPPLLSAVILTGCGSASVPTLAAGNAPEAVVATYLAAAQAGDNDTTQSLSTPEHAEAGTGLAGATPTITELALEPAEERTTEENDDTGDSLASGHDEATSVRTTFELSGGDDSMPDGPTTWSFLLVRDGDGPWLIADEGSA